MHHHKNVAIAWISANMLLYAQDNYGNLLTIIFKTFPYKFDKFTHVHMPCMINTGVKTKQKFPVNM